MLHIRPDLVQAVTASGLLIAALLLFLGRFGRPQRWLVAACVVLVLDQLSQAFAARHLLLAEEPVRFAPLLAGHLALGYVQNWHLGFGGDGQHLLLLTLLMIGFLLVLYQRLEEEHYHMAPLTELALALLVAGLLGALVDRVRVGYVVDFIRVFRGLGVACNLADLAALGAGVLLAVRGVGLLAAMVRGRFRAPARPAPARHAAQLPTVSATLVVTNLVLVLIWNAWPG